MPDKQISVPVGSRFMLSWSIDNRVKVTTVIKKNGQPVEIVDRNTSKFIKTEGKVTVDVTKDGTDCDFPAEKIDAKDEMKYVGTKPVTFRRFTAVVEPAQTGAYVYTISSSDGTVLNEQVDVTAKAPVNDKRQAMLDLIEKWMPTSIKNPKLAAGPNGNQTDLMTLANWSPAQGEASFRVQQANEKIKADWQAAKQKHDADPSAPDPGPMPTAFNGGLTPLVTSCGSVLGAMLKLWGCDFDGDGRMSVREFGISLDDPVRKTKGARTLGYYVDALEAFSTDPPVLPKPGDVLVLRDGKLEIGNDGRVKTNPPYRKSAGLAHVCIIVSVSEDMWVTANGGGGKLPDQAAGKADTQIAWTKPDSGGLPAAWPPATKALYYDGPHPNGIVCVGSVTDNQLKMVDGWVDLDKIPNPGFNADGSKKP